MRGLDIGGFSRKILLGRMLPQPHRMSNAEI
jgi:hypothetical protein